MEAQAVTLTRAQVRCLLVGPWLDGSLSLAEEHVVRVQQDSDGWIYAGFGDELTDEDDGGGVMIDPGGCMYASGPERERPDEDTCEMAMVQPGLLQVMPKRG